MKRNISLIPLPADISGSMKSAAFSGHVHVAAPAEWENLKVMLSDDLERHLDHIRCCGNEPTAGLNVLIEKAAVDPAGEANADESYTLAIAGTEVRIHASDRAGAFYATRTLLQLIQCRNGTAGVPEVLIKDSPRFGWRGLMIDVSRHFFTTDELRKLIDAMAYFKLNILHLHLTDDQGWRLEIKKYPRLTEVGSRRSGSMLGKYKTIERGQEYDVIPVEGFYTQQEMRDLIRYADERAVKIVPEIDMPGHMQAAIAAYPKLGTGDKVEVLRRWGVNPLVLNTSDETMAVMKDILNEVIDLFTGGYVHIGGDECPVTQWEKDPGEAERMKHRGISAFKDIQPWFTREIVKFVNERGYRTLAWDEALEGLDSSDIMGMCWRGNGIAAATRAAGQGKDVIMAPTSNTYFDYSQQPRGIEPLCIGGSLPLKKVYSWEPVPEELRRKPSALNHIKGGQGQLWTEYIKTTSQLEYMAFPRACALAEVLWTESEKKNWRGFSMRLYGQENHLTRMGVSRRYRTKSRKMGTVTPDSEGRYVYDLGKEFGEGSGFGHFQVILLSRSRLLMRIEKLELLGSGCLLDCDDHAARIGAVHQDNQFSFRYDRHEAGGGLQLVIHCSLETEDARLPVKPVDPIEIHLRKSLPMPGPLTSPGKRI